jgi:hypothetical protein
VAFAVAQLQAELGQFLSALLSDWNVALNPNTWLFWDFHRKLKMFAEHL